MQTYQLWHLFKALLYRLMVNMLHNENTLITEVIDTWWVYGVTSVDDPYFGYCASADEAVKVLQAFENATSCKFVATKADGNFACMDISARNHYVMFEGKVLHEDRSSISFCGQPFLVLSQRVYECEYRTDQHLKQTNQSHHRTIGTKVLTSSSTLHCPAKVVMKEVVLFPEYFIKENSESLKKKTSKRLRDALKTNIKLQVEQRIYISFPRQHRHNNLVTGETRDLIKPMLSNPWKRDADSFSLVWPTYEELSQSLHNHSEMDDLKLQIFTTEEEVNDYIEKVQVETATKFITQQKDKHFGDKNWKPDPMHRIYWRHPVSFSPTSIDFDGFPFMFVGRKILSCHQGPDQGQSKKRKRDELRRAMNMAPVRQVGSKKLGCKAQIYVSHIVKFPDYEIKKDTEKRRKTAASKLRNAIRTNNGNVAFNTLYLVKIPSTSSHEGHLLDVSESSRKKTKIDAEEMIFDNEEKLDVVLYTEQAEESSPDARKTDLMFQIDLKIDAIRECMNNVSDESCLLDMLQRLERTHAQALSYPVAVNQMTNPCLGACVGDTEEVQPLDEILINDSIPSQPSDNVSSMFEIHIDLAT